MKRKQIDYNKHEIVRLKDRMSSYRKAVDHYGWEYFDKIKAFRSEVSWKLEQKYPLRHLGELRK